MYDYLIVGAGLFGAVFAHEASLKGKRCLVIDRRGHVGGNVFCEKIEGITVHKYGAHIFHTDDKDIWDYVRRFAYFNDFVNSPLANYRGELYSLPFNMNTFSQLWGVKTPEQAKAVIDRQRTEAGFGGAAGSGPDGSNGHAGSCGAVGRKPRNLEEQAISLVGTDIFNKLIKGYTEKQWGRRCSELPASIITRLPVRFAFDNNYYNDKYQGIPVGGYNQIIEKMLEGCDVRPGVDFFDDAAGFRDAAAVTVFTGMIDEYYGCRFGALEYRSLRFETEVLETADFQGVAVVNYTSSDEPYTRIVEHKHFESGKQGKTVITREYPQEWARGFEAYYPIGDEANAARYSKYRALADNERGVIFGGRLGTYRYLDMWQVIKEALCCAKRNIA